MDFWSSLVSQLSLIDKFYGNKRPVYKQTNRRDGQILGTALEGQHSGLHMYAHTSECILLHKCTPSYTCTHIHKDTNKWRRWKDSQVCKEKTGLKFMVWQPLCEIRIKF